MANIINTWMNKIKKNPVPFVGLIALILIGIVVGKSTGLFNIDGGLPKLPTQMNGGSSGEDGTFTPYAVIIYPVADAEIGYYEYDKSSPYVFRVPIKLVLHDYDGDLKSYTIDWKVTASWGDIKDGYDQYRRLSSATLSPYVYDREISTSIEFTWWYLGVKEYTNVLFDIEIKFHMVDAYGNIKDMEQIRAIDGQMSVDNDLNTPDTVIIEDNTEESSIDQGEYYDDALGNNDGTFASPSFELFSVLIVLFALSYTLKRSRTQDKHKG